MFKTTLKSPPNNQIISNKSNTNKSNSKKSQQQATQWNQMIFITKKRKKETKTNTNVSGLISRIN